MRKHRALRDAGRASGVLQERDIFKSQRNRVQRLAAAFLQRILERDRVRNLPVRHHFLHVLDDKIRQHRLDRRKHVADLRRDHRPHAGAVEHLLQGICEVLEHDDRHGARVLQLVLQFARRVERIDVDDGQPGAQRAEQRDRILQQVRQHDRDPVAFLEAERILQVGAEVATGLVELPIADRHAHVAVGGQVGKAFTTRLEDLLQRRIRTYVDFRRNPLWITLQPDLFHRLPSLLPEATSASMHGPRLMPPASRLL